MVFDRLLKAGLKLSPRKCSLFRREVRYLGHIVSSDGLAMDPDKVKAIQDWPRPDSINDVRRFLGLCSYYTIPLLKAVQYLPDIVVLQRQLYDMCNHRLDLSDAETITMRAFLTTQGKNIP